MLTDHKNYIQAMPTQVFMSKCNFTQCKHQIPTVFEHFNFFFSCCLKSHQSRSDHYVGDGTYKLFLNIVIWWFQKCHTIMKTPGLT